MKHWPLIAVALVVVVFVMNGAQRPAEPRGRAAPSERDGSDAKARVPMLQLSQAQGPQEVRTRSRKVRLRGDRRGHFNVKARVGGRTVPFVVDTGATAVAINLRTARRLGLRVRKQDFTGRSSTANGIVAYAPATIPEIRIGGIKVRNVRAAVLPDRALSTNLLGMTFLSRLKRFAVEGNGLVMEGRAF